MNTIYLAEKDLYESILDDLPAGDDSQSSVKIAASSTKEDTKFLTSPDWYKYWMNQGCWQLFLIEIPVYQQVDFISEFRQIDWKVRATFDNLSNAIQMSELVPVSFYEENYMREHYSELIDSGELLLEQNPPKDLSVDKWVATKYFYKFFVKLYSIRNTRRLLKLFASLGSICLETERKHHYKITFKIITYNNNHTERLDYADMRSYGLWAFDIVTGKRVTDKAVYTLASKFFYIFGLEGKYGKDPGVYVYKELLDIQKRKKEIKNKIRKGVNESVLDNLDAIDTKIDSLIPETSDVTYQEWYRRHTKNYSHLIVLYKYFCGNNSQNEIPMVKEIFKNLVSRYYPDCSDVQIVTTQQSFNQECKKFNVQYEPNYMMSGGVILDGVKQTTNFEPCFKICVNIPIGVRRDFERFLDCIASLYSLCNLQDSGDYRGGKVEIYRKENIRDEHFVHNETKFGTNDMPGIDAYNYKFDKNMYGTRFSEDDFKYTVKGYSKFKAFEYTSEEDLMNRLKQWYDKVQIFKKR